MALTRISRDRPAPALSVIQSSAESCWTGYAHSVEKLHADARFLREAVRFNLKAGPRRGRDSPYPMSAINLARTSASSCGDTSPLRTAFR